MDLLTDFPERIVDLPRVYVGPDERPFEVEGVRFHRGGVLLKLRSIDDRNAAETLRGALVQVDIEHAVPLEEGEYYHFQLEGLEVITEDGEHLGEIVEVLSTPGVNDVYIVHGLRGEVLIPGVQEVVQALDLEEGRMVVRLLPGLIEGT